MLRLSLAISPDDHHRQLRDSIGQMNQKRERRFVSPLKILEDSQLRSALRPACQRLREALEKIAALLRGRQFHWLRNIRKNPPKARRHLCQLGRVFSQHPTEIISPRRLREHAFNDLDEGQKWKRFVSFVAVPYRASEANPPGVVRHLLRSEERRVGK